MGRPAKYSEENLHELAESLAEPLFKQLKIEDKILEHLSDLEDALLECNNDLDGFEIAKSLEGWPYDWWKLNAQSVRILDTAEARLYRIHKDKISKWVKDNNIKPKLQVGDKVKTPDGEGRISYLHKDEATYSVYTKTKQLTQLPDSSIAFVKLVSMYPYEQVEKINEEN